MQSKQVTITETKLRYHWAKPSDLPERVELIDKVTSQPAAVILIIDRQYEWQRNTSTMIHGAPPADGKCSSLQEAKERVLHGLKNEM